jgi:NadR type nicotinamide-nucleotide adenylyltransferase
VSPLRVVVTGSESTGKTTLAARLAAHYGTIAVPEFSRVYAASAACELTPDDVEPIALGQLAAERQAEARTGRLLVQDTNLLSTLVYAEHYYGVAPRWIAGALRDHPADLYLVCDVDVPWVPDPARDRGYMRSEMHALFAAAVRETGVPFVVIRGDWEQRFRAAVEAVDALTRNADSGAGRRLPRGPSTEAEGVNGTASGRDG